METPPLPNLPEENKTTTLLVNQKDSSLAIASLVTGILGWTLVPLLGSIAAIITGHLAKKEIKESQGTISGDSMATAGLIMGYVQLGLVIIAAIIAIILILVAGANWVG
jgi:hypothetical protein